MDITAVIGLLIYIFILIILFSILRRHIRRGLSVKYLIPDPALDYIYKNQLYKDTTKSAL